MPSRATARPLHTHLGAGASRPGSDSRHWRGRDSTRQRAQISDLGVSDRPGLYPTAVDWQGTDRENLQGVLHHDWSGGVGEDRVRLLGHVETLFGCDPREMFPGLTTGIDERSVL